jgi:hypothetical protein
MGISFSRRDSPDCSYRHVPLQAPTREPDGACVSVPRNPNPYCLKCQIGTFSCCDHGDWSMHDARQPLVSPNGWGH